MGRRTEFAANHSPGPAERKANEIALPSTLVYMIIFIHPNQIRQHKVSDDNKQQALFAM
jgi:hypothetical protein